MFLYSGAVHALLHGLQEVLRQSTMAASVLGGMLWQVHGMQAGFFPAWERLWRDLRCGAETGWHVGWQLLAMSQRDSLLCLLGFVGGTLKCGQWVQMPRRTDRGQGPEGL